MLAILLASALVNPVLSAKCEIACRYEGMDSGYYVEIGKCACVSYFLTKDLFDTPKIRPPKWPKSNVKINQDGVNKYYDDY